MNDVASIKASNDKYILSLKGLDNQKGEHTLNNSLTISFNPENQIESKSIQNLRKERTR